MIRRTTVTLGIVVAVMACPMLALLDIRGLAGFPAGTPDRLAPSTLD